MVKPSEIALAVGATVAAGLLVYYLTQSGQSQNAGGGMPSISPVTINLPSFPGSTGGAVPVSTGPGPQGFPVGPNSYPIGNSLGNNGQTFPVAVIPAVGIGISALASAGHDIENGASMAVSTGLGVLKNILGNLRFGF